MYVSPLSAGFGVKNKILEAMALGTPIVATSRSLSGLADVVPGVHLLHADSDEQIAAAVQRLLNEPALADHLAGNARRLVEQRYTWKAVAARYEAVFGGGHGLGPRHPTVGLTAAPCRATPTCRSVTRHSGTRNGQT